MSISGEKTNIVINNYFKTECSVDTTIREAFEKGFRLGMKKVKAIENAPTIPQWISCSERLPMMGEYVLTYRPTMGMRMIVDAYEGYYGEDDIDEWHEGWVYGGDKVVAWMPLPEPYREEGEA